MPFKSKAQRRLFWAKVDKGEITEAKAREWERETKDKNLPEHIKKKAAVMNYPYYLGACDASVKLGTTALVRKIR